MPTDEVELERILDGPVKQLLGGLAHEFGTTAFRLPGTLDGIRIKFPGNVFIVVWVTGNDKVKRTKEFEELAKEYERTGQGRNSDALAAEFYRLQVEAELAVGQ